jgi:hypothetical protein
MDEVWSKPRKAAVPVYTEREDEHVIAVMT